MSTVYSLSAVLAAPAGGGARGIRRLAAAVLTLALVDQFVPGRLERAERARYEGAEVYHFPYSDLFATGPAVAYLRDHPRGDRPRAVFFGNSVVWGFRLPPADAIPERFQQLDSSVRVFNFAVNTFASISAFLLLKNVIDSVDTIYLPLDGNQANAGLARLIPVSDEDVHRYNLDPPDRLEQRLERMFGWWRLYRDSYRLQTAFLGTSTRNFLYAHKSSLLGGAPDPGRDNLAPNRPSPKPLTVFHRVAEAEPSQAHLQELAAAEPLAFEFASFIRAHGKRAVFWRVDNEARASSAIWDGLNRAFSGSIVFITIAAPPEMMMDQRHLTANGSAAVAAALRHYTPVPDAPHHAVH